MTPFSTEHVPAKLLREGKVIYDVTLDLIVVGGPLPDPRSIVRMDLSQGTVVENGYYALKFIFGGKQFEDTVYVKGTLMNRLSS